MPVEKIVSLSNSYSACLSRHRSVVISKLTHVILRLCCVTGVAVESAVRG